MTNVLKADLFNLRRGKALYLLLGGAVLAGILLPLIYYGMFEFLKFLQTNEQMLEIEELQKMLSTLAGITEYLNADRIFLTVLPMAEGYGLIICGAVCFYNVRQFSNGVIRNKLIAGKSRFSIYMSMLITSVIMTLAAALVNLVVSALFSMILFGKFVMPFGDLVVIFVITLLVYAVYSAIVTFIAFSTKSVPASLVISIVLPIITNTILSLLGTLASTLPDFLIPVFAILPSMQSILVMSGIVGARIIVVSVIADTAWIVILSLIGILKFKKADIN